ncbi:hypothetical protein ACQKIY_25475 [Bacillus mycoides]|uniref:hypothetical protein n=1 Tax=Bacillus mycoides TaxID=1405 RepID=UPI003D004447
MPPLKDLTGKQFGILIVINRADNKRGRPHWNCKCECGNESVVEGAKLNSGHTKSCGCLTKGRYKGSKNRIVELDDCYELFDRKENSFVIDKEDLDVVAKTYWWINSAGYAVNSSDELLHRKLMNPSDEELVDHKDGIKTNNRKLNLKRVIKSENQFNAKLRSNNTTGYVGVYKRRNSYFVTIGVNKKTIYLGQFKNIEDAVEARKRAEIKYYGRLAYGWGEESE